jgi:hypothetical protein
MGEAVVGGSWSEAGLGEKDETLSKKQLKQKRMELWLK